MSAGIQNALIISQETVQKTCNSCHTNSKPMRIWQSVSSRNNHFPIRHTWGKSVVSPVRSLFIPISTSLPQEDSAGGILQRRNICVCLCVVVCVVVLLCCCMRVCVLFFVCTCLCVACLCAWVCVCVFVCFCVFVYVFCVLVSVLVCVLRAFVCICVSLRAWPYTKQNCLKLHSKWLKATVCSRSCPLLLAI